MGEEKSRKKVGAPGILLLTDQFRNHLKSLPVIGHKNIFCAQSESSSFRVTFVTSYSKVFTAKLFARLGPVVRSLVSANRWLRGIKTYRFPWDLTLVSANHASSNPGQFAIYLLARAGEFPSIEKCH